MEQEGIEGSISVSYSSHSDAFATGLLSEAYNLSLVMTVCPTITASTKVCLHVFISPSHLPQSNYLCSPTAGSPGEDRTRTDIASIWIGLDCPQPINLPQTSQFPFLRYQNPTSFRGAVMCCMSGNLI